MDLISTGDAAKILGVSSDSIRRWIESGKLNGYTKMGKGLHLFVDRAQIAELKKREVVQIKPKKK